MRVAKVNLFIIIFLCLAVSIASADIGGSLSFSLTKGDSKVTPGLISIGQAILVDNTLVSFFPDSQAVGLTVGTNIEISATFLPGDEENDREMAENGELRIEGYLQGGHNLVPMTWVPSQKDYFVGNYSVNIPMDGSVRGGHNVVLRIWSTRGVTEWVVVFIPITTHQEGYFSSSPYAINIELPKEVGWEKHPIDYCSNIYACDGTGYYSWTDTKQMKLYQQSLAGQVQQTSVQSFSSTSTSQLFQELLSLRTTSGKSVTDTCGFFFITSKPFSFLNVVTDPANMKKELFRASVKPEEWKHVGENLYVYVPTFSSSGRVFIDEKTTYISNSSQKVEKVGQVSSFLHDFSTYQVVEICQKGGH